MYISAARVELIFNVDRICALVQTRQGVRAVTERMAQGGIWDPATGGRGAPQVREAWTRVCRALVDRYVYIDGVLNPIRYVRCACACERLCAVRCDRAPG